jgi:Bacterial archaeo-eukaryotic release factor family 10
VAAPDRKELAELLEWRPPLGILSVCLEIDPADRSEGWRIALRDRLKRTVEEARDQRRELRLALRATVERVLERVPGDTRHPHGRTQVGFVEVAASGGRERWFAFQVPPRRAEVTHADRPDVLPLVELVESGGRLYVAAVSAERVRLWEWEMGEIREAASWEPRFRKREWRERRARVSRDLASAQFPKAAGADQYDQRLEANRERFLREVGAEMRDTLRRRPGRMLLAFGERPLVEQVEEGLGPDTSPRQLETKDVVGESGARIAERVAGVLGRVNQARELELVAQARDAAHAGGRAALGLQETLQSLEETRVSHLLLDAEREFSLRDVALPGWAQDADVASELASRMIERALLTGADVTPVAGDAAAQLDVGDGAAALLRY